MWVHLSVNAWQRVTLHWEKLGRVGIEQDTKNIFFRFLVVEDRLESGPHDLYLFMLLYNSFHLCMGRICDIFLSNRIWLRWWDGITLYKAILLEKLLWSLPLLAVLEETRCHESYKGKHMNSPQNLSEPGSRTCPSWASRWEASPDYNLVGDSAKLCLDS